jgi:hypothetical protein
VHIQACSWGPTHQSKYIQLEREAVDTQFVVISDFHLDSPRVLSNFRSILNGYNESGNRPALFILCGNFSSKPFLFDGRSTLSFTGACEFPMDIARFVSDSRNYLLKPILPRSRIWSPLHVRRSLVNLASSLCQGQTTHGTLRPSLASLSPLLWSRPLHPNSPTRPLRRTHAG